MPEITLRYDDNDFAEVVKRKTQHLKDNKLFYYTIFELATIESERPEEIFEALKTELKLVPHKQDRLVFISELLVHLGTVREELMTECGSEPRSMNLLNDVVHYLFRELEKLKLGVDGNAFSLAEIRQMSDKVNLIVARLEALQGGQEVIFKRIEELKADYRDILNTFGLGKKPFFQRFAGIFAAYAGEKGADEAYQVLLPMIKEVVRSSILLLK